MMTMIAKKMSENEMLAVSYYLSTAKGEPKSP